MNEKCWSALRVKIESLLQQVFIPTSSELVNLFIKTSHEINSNYNIIMLLSGSCLIDIWMTPVWSWLLELECWWSLNCLSVDALESDKNEDSAAFQIPSEFQIHFVIGSPSLNFMELKWFPCLNKVLMKISRTKRERVKITVEDEIIGIFMRNSTESFGSYSASLHSRTDLNHTHSNPFH